MFYSWVDIWKMYSLYKHKWNTGRAFTQKYDFVALICNRPSGIYSLSAFSEKVSPGRQIFHHVAPYYQVAVLPFSKIHKNDICWVYKSCIGEATNGPGKITGTLNFHWVKGQMYSLYKHKWNTWRAFTQKYDIFACEKITVAMVTK